IIILNIEILKVMNRFKFSLYLLNNEHKVYNSLDRKFGLKRNFIYHYNFKILELDDHFYE
ncbi:hypothetical protein BUZ42_12310, partial [Staphylococcus haemolyticus]